jgi:hypothetical protein
MGILKKSALGLVASALVVTSAAPAMARDYRYDGYGRHHRHHDRIDGGDVLTGIGILAGIAILAGAVSSSSKKSRTSERYPDQYPQRSENSSYQGGSDDVGAAVSACSQAAERSAGDGTRVDEIRSVTRDGSAWLVEGALGGGRNSGSFRCSATYGQVDYIRLG